MKYGTDSTKDTDRLPVSRRECCDYTSMSEDMAETEQLQALQKRLFPAPSWPWGYVAVLVTMLLLAAGLCGAAQ